MARALVFGDGQPVGDTVLTKHRDVDGGVHLVQAGDDRRGVNQADEDVAETKGHGEQGREQAEDGVLEPDEDRADEEDGGVGGDRDGHERGHEEVEHVRNDLVHLLLDGAQDPGAHQNGDDVALIADPVDAVEARDDVQRDHGAVGDGVSRAPGVAEAAGDEQRAEGGAQVGVATEDCCRGEAQQNLQVGKGAGVDEAGDTPPHAIGVDGDHAGVGHELERAHDAHEHTGGHDGGDDGHEHVGKDLDGGHELVLVLCRDGLQLVLGDG